jgi:hypothetical protein
MAVAAAVDERPHRATASAFGARASLAFLALAALTPAVVLSSRPRTVHRLDDLGSMLTTG